MNCSPDCKHYDTLEVEGQNCFDEKPEGDHPFCRLCGDWIFDGEMLDECVYLKKLKNLKRRFNRNVTALNQIIKELKEIYPEANYYLSNDCLNVMSGPSHDDLQGRKGTFQRERQDRVLWDRTLKSSGGGDW